MGTRHEVRKSDGSRAAVQITSRSQSPGSTNRQTFDYRIDDFGNTSGTAIKSRCSICRSHVATIRAVKDDLCGSCLSTLSHALNEAQKTTGERGKDYRKKG